MDIEEHGAGGIGHIGHMHLSLGEVPEQPGIHGAKGQFPSSRFFPCTCNIIQDPAELGGGKISVDDQACFFADGFFQALVAFSSSQKTAVRRSCHTMAL